MALSEGGRPAYRDMEDSELEGDETDAFADAIAQAFPAEDWDEDRLAALKEGIALCVEADREGAYDREKPARSKPKRGGIGVLLDLSGERD